MFKIYNKHTRPQSFSNDSINTDRVLVSLMLIDSTHTCKTSKFVFYPCLLTLFIPVKHPNTCLSNDKCSILRKQKYFDNTIKSLREKWDIFIEHSMFLDGNERLQGLVLLLIIL